MKPTTKPFWPFLALRCRKTIGICLICCLVAPGLRAKPTTPETPPEAESTISEEATRPAWFWPYDRHTLRRHLSDLLADWGETTVAVDAALVRHVCYFYKYYTVIDRRGTNTVLRRSEDYHPRIQEIFAEFGLPEELAFAVPFVESAFRNKARSDKKAMGMFQFLKGTAKAYGLTVSAAVDERMDYQKAARACAAYLSENRDKFNSIVLGIGSFHNGTARLNRVLRQLPGEDDGVDFVSIFNHRRLGKYSKEYIPKCLAAALFFRFLKERQLAAIPDMEMDRIALPRFAYVSDLQENHPDLLTLNPDLQNAKTTYLYATTRGYLLVADMALPEAIEPAPPAASDTLVAKVENTGISEKPTDDALEQGGGDTTATTEKNESSIVASTRPKAPEPLRETVAVPRLVGMKWDDSLMEKYKNRDIVMNESYTGVVAEIGVVFDQNLKSGDEWPENEVLIVEIGRPPVPEDELSPEEYYRFIQEYMKTLRKRG